MQQQPFAEVSFEQYRSPLAARSFSTRWTASYPGLTWPPQLRRCIPRL